MGCSRPRRRSAAERVAVCRARCPGSSATRAASVPADRRSATPAWTSRSISPTSAARPDTSPAKDHPHCVGRSTKPRKPRAGPAALTAPASPSPANCSSAASTSCANSATKPYNPPDPARRSVRARPFLTPMPRGPLPRCRCRHPKVDGLQRLSGRNASPRGNTPSTITSPARNTGSRTEISPGARTHHNRPDHHAHDPPSHDVTREVDATDRHR